jgi:heptosyltransferase II
LAEPTHILIARLSSIGDIILTSPVVRVVHEAYPNAKITFLVKKEFASIVQYNPYIGQVITFDKSGGRKALVQLKEKIRNEKFDWFIDLHNNLRTNYIKLFIRFPEVSTYSKQSFRRWLLVKFRKNIFRDAKPVYLKYFDAVKSRNLQYDDKGTEVYFPVEESDKIDKKLIADQVNPTLPMVVICPGASFSNKQWLPERISQLADILIEQKKAQIVFLGGPNDASLCNSIMVGMKYNAFNYAGQLALPGSAALLRKAGLVITHDSGMMHLAQSQHTPVVAIFGPTTKEMGFFPLVTDSRVVEKDVPCRPCTTKGLNYCPKKHFNCMRFIEISDVMNAVNELTAKQ